MTNILALDSSIFSPERSASRPLTAQLLTLLRNAHPRASIRYRDLHADQLPHASLALFASAAVAGEPTLSTILVDELVAADILVIGAPLYNLGIPSTLKAWIDHVVIAGKTFRYTPGGLPEGLLRDKKVFVVTTRGGIYSEGPTVSLDIAIPYLRVSLGFMGLTDIRFVVAEGLSMGPKFRAEGLARAERDIAGLLVPV